MNLILSVFSMANLIKAYYIFIKIFTFSMIVWFLNQFILPTVLSSFVLPILPSAVKCVFVDLHFGENLSMLISAFTVRQSLVFFKLAMN